MILRSVHSSVPHACLCTFWFISNIIELQHSILQPEVDFPPTQHHDYIPDKWLEQYWTSSYNECQLKDWGLLKSNCRAVKPADLGLCVNSSGTLWNQLLENQSSLCVSSFPIDLYVHEHVYILFCYERLEANIPKLRISCLYFYSNFTLAFAIFKGSYKIKMRYNSLALLDSFRWKRTFDQVWLYITIANEVNVKSGVQKTFAITE